MGGSPSSFRWGTPSITPSCPVVPLPPDPSPDSTLYQSASARSAVVYVDAILGIDSGVNGGRRGTTLAYKTLAAVVPVLQPHDYLVVRGTFTDSGYVTISTPGVTIDASGAKFVAQNTATSVADGRKIVLAADGINLYGLEIDGNNAATPYTGNSFPDSGMIEVSGKNCRVASCYIHDTASSGVRFVSGYDGSTVTLCTFDRCRTAITSAGYSPVAGGLTVSFNNCLNCYRGGYRAAFNQGYAITGEKVLFNTITYNLGAIPNGSDALGIELFGGAPVSPAACPHQSALVQGNTVKGYPTAISLNGCNAARANDNALSGFSYIGLEEVNSFYISANNNALDCAGGGVGYSLDCNPGNTPNQDAYYEIHGGTITNANANAAIHSYVAYHLIIDDVTTYGSALPIWLQFGKDILVKNCRLNIDNSTVTTAVGIVIELDVNRATGSYHLTGNEIKRKVPTGNDPAVIEFYANSALVTTDVVLENNWSNSTFCGAGFVQFANVTLSDTLAISGNLPNATGSQYGFVNVLTASALKGVTSVLPPTGGAITQGATNFAGPVTGITGGISYVTGLSTASDAATATANTAAIQAAHDALPAGGGRIILPPGRFNLSGNVNLTKPCAVLGQGAGSTLVSTANVDMFTVNAAKGVFEDIDFESTLQGTAATAGAFIHYVAFTPSGSHVDHCSFLSGWVHVQIDNGNAWTITNNVSSEAAKYGFDIADAAAVDAGDNVMSGNWIGTSHATANSAAVHYRSGGGLKFFGNKVNGGASGQFTYGLWLDITAGTATSILLVNGNSLENIANTGIYENLGIPGQATFDKLVIDGNEFYNMLTGIDVGNYTSATNTSGRMGLTVGVNHYDHVDTCVRVDHWTGGHIASQSAITAVNHIVVLGANVFGMHVATQAHVNNNARGYTIETAQVGSGSEHNPIDFSTRGFFANGSTTREVAIHFGMYQYTGVVVRVHLSGYVSGAGMVHAVMVRNLLYDGTTLTQTTVGTDVLEGSAATNANVNFQWTVSGNEVQMTQGIVNQGFNYDADVKVEGALQFLKIGP